MKTILYHEKFSPLTEQLVESSGNMDIMPGDRVLVGESLLFQNDIITPWQTILRPGTVTKRYGILAYTYDDDTIFGPYPDYVDIEMDEIRPTGDRMTGSFTHAVIKINSLKGQEAIKLLNKLGVLSNFGLITQGETLSR